MLVATVLGFLLMPALNAISRGTSAKPTITRGRTSPAIGPFVTAMTKLADQNLAERTPNKFVEWLFHSHPSIGRRVTAAEQWAKNRHSSQRA